MVASVWQLLFVLLILLFYFFNLFSAYLSSMYLSLMDEVCELGRGGKRLVGEQPRDPLPPNFATALFSVNVSWPWQTFWGSRGSLTELVDWSRIPLCSWTPSLQGHSGLKDVWMICRNPQPPYALCHISPLFSNFCFLSTWWTLSPC